MRFRYTLTNEGLGRCVKNEFYLQNAPIYKGYTEKIFRALNASVKPLTLREISGITGIRPRAVNGVITFNIYAGYIKRLPL